MPCLIITLSLCGKRMQLLPGWLRENENYIKDNEKTHWVALFKKHKIHLLVCLVQWHITHYVKSLVHTIFHWALWRAIFWTCAVTVKVTVKQQLHCRARISLPLAFRLQAWFSQTSEDKFIHPTQLDQCKRSLFLKMLMCYSSVIVVWNKLNVR